MNPPDLSIISVSYNTREYMRRCLQALYAKPTRYSFEVIIVDNASKDEPDKILSEFPGVRLIKNRYNVGFAEANNQAYLESRGRFVMTLNPDTEVDSGCLDSLCGFLDANPAAGLAAAVSLDEDGRVNLPLTTFGLLDPPAAINVLKRRLMPQASSPIPTAPVRVDWVWTTGYVCRREALRQDVFFHDSLFLFVEEYELCRGIRDRGYEIFVVPSARLLHHQSVTWNRNEAKLMMARQLGMAGLWSARRKEYGAALASLNQAIIMGEASLFWAAMALEGRLKGKPRLSLTDYRARAIASYRLLREGHAFVERINQEAELFFNNGIPRPKVIREEEDSLCAGAQERR